MELYHTIGLWCNISDHFPLRVGMEHTEIQRKKNIFKFLKCVVENTEFMSILRDNWKHEEQGIPMYKIKKKLQNLQLEMSKLNRKVTVGVKKLQDGRSSLDHAQHLLEGDIFNQDHIKNVNCWTDEVIKSTEMKEKILRQKSKIDVIRHDVVNAVNDFFWSN